LKIQNVYEVLDTFVFTVIKNKFEHKYTLIFYGCLNLLLYLMGAIKMTNYFVVKNEKLKECFITIQYTSLESFRQDSS